jgi:NAD-dependent dihydropyrimidine dehydrogenase PreA subunit
MKKAAQQFLVDRASPPGMLACGLRLPNGKYVCRSIEEICPAGKMEKILAQFEGLRSALFTEKLSPRWSTWAFEQGQIRFVERPDGWLLGLVVRTESDAVSGLDPLSVEFLSLKLGK